MIAVDLETTGLDCHKDQIISIAIYDAVSDPMVIMWEDFFSPQYETIRKKLQDPDMTLLFHNAKFDLKFLEVNNFKMFNKIEDTLLMSYVLNPGRESHKLKDLVETFCGYKMVRFTELVGKGRTKQHITEVDPERFKSYASDDVKYLYNLYVYFSRQLSQQPFLDRLYHKLELPLLHVLMAMELRGVRIDRRKLEALEKETRSLCAKALRSLRRYKHFNYNSTKQLREYLFQGLRLHAIKNTNKGEQSTDRETLQALAELHPFPKALLSYREITKRLSTYIKPLLTEANDEDTVHTTFNQALTETGRLSSSDPINFQNIPKRSPEGNKIRGCFTARPGYVLLEADYAQIEPRLVAHLSGDISFQQLFNAGKDPYIQVLRSLGLPDADRGLGKVLMLAAQYGARPAKLCKSAKTMFNVEITEDEAETFLNKLKAKYSTLFSWRDQVVAQARSVGYVTTMFHRIRYIDNITSHEMLKRWTAEREAFNTKIQGSAADIIKLAMIELDKAFKAQLFDAHILIQVHDSLLVEVRNECFLVQLVRDEMERVMCSIAALKVPLKIEMKMTDYWGGK
jgi:DNA polymerase-1